MENRRNFKEQRKHPRYEITLFFEYWETYGPCHGGLVGNVSEIGLLVYYDQDISIGRELMLKVFFFDGYELDSIKVLAVIWKELHCDRDWKGYKYGLEFIRLSQQNQRKFAKLLTNRSPSEDSCRYLVIS